MNGLMSDRPMLLIDILRHASEVYSDSRITSCAGGQADHSYSYAEALDRVSLISTVLQQMGCGVGTLVGTLSWNHFQHFEIYYGTAAIGSICHTINPRLSSAQIGELIELAGDSILFVDGDLIELIRPLMSRPDFPRVVLLGQLSAAADAASDTWVRYEDLIADSHALGGWPSFDERTASSLCYTSGTTGKPKGVLYSHRSSVLHAMSICRTDTWAISGDDVVCSFAPMFHVNAWGLPFAAPLCGADLVLPGPHLSATAIYQLLEEQQVTLAFAVPTLWHELLTYMTSTGLRFSTLRRVVVSGSSISKEMMTTFEDVLNVEVLHVWGMTESSPMGMVSRLSRRMKQLPHDVQFELKGRQGHPVFGTELCLLSLQDDRKKAEGSEGELAMRGLWTASAYYKGDRNAADSFTENGWFKTGDVAKRDHYGFYQIFDRRKDAIKSGGEWISSLELEAAASMNSQVISVAAVAIPHPKWGERPVLAIVAKNPLAFNEKDLLATIGTVMQKWAVPDYVVLFEALPMTSTGKIDKGKIRTMVRALDTAQKCTIPTS